MFEFLGTPDQETMELLFQLTPFKQQVKKKFSFFKAVDLSFCFRHLSYGIELYDLILKMLNLNPSRRITCEEALNHPLFSKLK